MPTYEYQCNICGHKFEKFQSITADALCKCPDCGRMELKRLIGTGAGIIFKGSGFYETDYRSDGYKKAVKKETPKSDSDSGKKEASSSEPAKSSEKNQANSGTKASGNNSDSKKENNASGK